MTFTKQDEGNVVYAIPTGNNARRGIEEQNIVSFKVEKVKRKYIDLVKIDENGKEWGTNSYCPKTGVTQSAINSGYANNAGYKFFRSIDDIEKFYKISKMKDEIYDFFRRYSYTLCDKDIETIYNIIKKDK